MRITRTTEAASLIVENCWNGGVVVGTPKPASCAALVGISGHLTIGGKSVGEGAAEDPSATLAWLANHLAERGRDLKAGMVVITGSLIPTISIASGRARGVYGRWAWRNRDGCRLDRARLVHVALRTLRRRAHLTLDLQPSRPKT